MDRVGRMLRSAFDAALGLGSLLAPLLVSTLSLPAAMAVTGGALILLAAVLWPTARTVDTLMAVDPAAVDLFAGIALFAPMSQIGLERLARAARPREFAAAQVVVGQGEPADGYYLVAEGLVTVSVDGHDVRRMGPGEGFGEIAPGSRRSAGSRPRPARRARRRARAARPAPEVRRRAASLRRVGRRCPAGAG